MQKLVNAKAVQTSSAPKPQTASQDFQSTFPGGITSDTLFDPRTEALAAISETIPTPFQSIAIKYLNGVYLKPEDFLPTPAKEGSASKANKGRVGRPAAEQKPFPTSFPAGSGITYSNLYDPRTTKIIGGCLRRLQESRLFSEAELEDCRIDLMEALPFMLQGFKPQTAVKDARYKFTSTALGHRTDAIFNKRSSTQRPVSLNREINEDGELIDALGEKDCADLCVYDKGFARMEALEELAYLVSKLPERDTLLILMKHHLGMTEEEIAPRLQLSRSAVHKRLVAIPELAKTILREAEVAR